MKNEAWKKYTDAGALARVTLRLILPDEKARWDELICQRHYLKNANLVGRQLRYVAELDGEWVALLGWNVPAFHLRPREDWANWSIGQRLKRRKFWVQNSRFLLLSELGKFPNLASRVLGLCCQRLSQDWDEAFGHPLLAAESFVDPQQFTGSCYRASGWELLGQTKGCRRHHRDFYQDDGHPKELWVRPLHPKARTWLGAGEMPERIRPAGGAATRRRKVQRDYGVTAHAGGRAVGRGDRHGRCDARPAGGGPLPDSGERDG